MAILLVEHDVQLVMQVCTHIHVLDFGAILAVGSARRDPAEPRGARRLPGRAGRGERMTDTAAAAAAETADPGPVPMLELIGVRAALRTDRGPPRRRPRRAEGERRRPARPQRWRQDHHAEGGQRTDRGDRRMRPPRRAARERRRARTRWPASGSARSPRAAGSSRTSPCARTSAWSPMAASASATWRIGPSPSSPG